MTRELNKAFSAVIVILIGISALPGVAVTPLERTVEEPLTMDCLSKAISSSRVKRNLRVVFKVIRPPGTSEPELRPALKRKKNRIS